MEYKKLGESNLEISRIGFGCWAIGGHGYGKVNDQESIKAVRKALDLGINFFDTADVYGFGHSEEILSKALGPQRNKVIVATKFGVNWDKNGKTYRDCSPKRILEAVEASLARLKLDCIPLYQIHWYDGKTSISEMMETLKKCQKEGKILYVGCSNFPLELILEALETDRLESNQLLYNIVQRDSEIDISRCAKKLKMAILVYGVLGRGLFSGRYGVDARFGDQDTREREEHFQGETLKRILKWVDKIKEIGAAYNKTPSQIAIRWVLENENITCAITGIKNAEQIKENVGALGWKLSKKDFHFIEKKMVAKRMEKDKKHVHARESLQEP
jgi:aryl-alcohol dehydrogenase-like predicted oxidoreductase